MKLYLIRHGESENNKTNTHNTEEVALSELGHIQAKKVAEVVKKISPDVLFASNLKRAQQTAEHISNAINLPIITEANLKEIKRPTELIGKNYDDPYVKEVKRLMWDNAENEHYHFSDEENFVEFKNRCKKQIKIFENCSEQYQNIVAVSHGYTIRMIVAMANMESFIKPNFIEAMRYFWQVNNTSITRLDYIRNKWHLVTWNDFDHLKGEEIGVSA